MLADWDHVPECRAFILETDVLSCFCVAVWSSNTLFARIFETFSSPHVERSRSRKKGELWVLAYNTSEIDDMKRGTGGLQSRDKRARRIQEKRQRSKVLFFEDKKWNKNNFLWTLLLPMPPWVSVLPRQPNRGFWLGHMKILNIPWWDPDPPDTREPQETCSKRWKCLGGNRECHRNSLGHVGEV